MVWIARYKMVQPIGYVVRTDFNDAGDLNAALKPAVIMIKSKNCKYCVMAEPEFRAVAASRGDVNSFFSQPFDGMDLDQLRVADILPQITRSEEVGLPTYVLYPVDRPRVIHTGMMNRAQLSLFINNAPPPAVETPAPAFLAYNR